MTIQPLEPTEQSALLSELNGTTKAPWTITEHKLCKTFTFGDFNDAWAFMNRVAPMAEAMGHHPDWTNVYNRVEIKLNTHDAGGVVTQNDFDLAHHIEAAARG